MAWDIELTDECREWFEGLPHDEQGSVARIVGLLAEHGVALDHPYTSAINGSKHGHMRELRIQHHGRPIRVLYCFDPRRTGILLLGGDKTGNDRWYDECVPKADTIYDEYLAELRKDGLI